MRYIESYKLFEDVRAGFNDRKVKSTIEDLQYDYDFDIKYDEEIDDGGDVDRFFLEFGPDGRWGWFNVFLELNRKWHLESMIYDEEFITRYDEDGKIIDQNIFDTIHIRQGDMDGLIRHLKSFVEKLNEFHLYSENARL